MSTINSQAQQQSVAATFLAQARILCDGAQDFLEDAERVARLKKISVALSEECAHLQRRRASAGSAAGGETGDQQAAASADISSRIEQLNAELLECERLYQQLDQLTSAFNSASGETKTSEDIILKSNADYSEKRLLDRMETLFNGLTLERPVTARETLIFALRALAPFQEILMAVSEEHNYERKQGCIACRLLQGIVPALEEIAGVTRSELGFEEPQTEAEIIEKLKSALAQKSSI